MKRKEIQLTEKIKGWECFGKTIPEAQRNVDEAGLIALPSYLFPGKLFYTQKSYVTNTVDFIGRDDDKYSPNKDETFIITVHGGVDGWAFPPDQVESAVLRGKNLIFPVRFLHCFCGGVQSLCPLPVSAAGDDGIPRAGQEGVFQRQKLYLRASGAVDAYLVLFDVAAGASPAALLRHDTLRSRHRQRPASFSFFNRTRSPFF